MGVHVLGLFSLWYDGQSAWQVQQLLLQRCSVVEERQPRDTAHGVWLENMENLFRKAEEWHMELWWLYTVTARSIEQRLWDDR